MQLIFFLLLRHGRRKYTAGLMLKFNEEKLAKLRTFDDVLQENMASLIARLARILMPGPRLGIMQSCSRTSVRNRR